MRPAPSARTFARLRFPIALIAALSAGASTSAATWPPVVPEVLRLEVRENAGIARTAEVVRSGVPLPRSLDLRSTAGLAVVDALGSLVPAQFAVQARWNAGPAADAPIQWLLVSFPATVPANGSANYRLVLDGSAGSNPAPATPLTVTRAGNLVTVNTGAARFTFGGDAGALFQELRRGDGTLLASGGAMTAVVDAASGTHTTTRSVVVEEEGPLTAVVRVEGAYDFPAVGGGAMASERRYRFSAGSPTAVVVQSIAWEGSRCGLDQLVCAGNQINGRRLERVRVPLTLALGSPLTLTAIGDADASAVGGSATSAQSASIRQRRRASRHAARAFEVVVPGTAGAAGTDADGALLATSGGNGAVAIALERMHRYEPQALRLLDGGVLAIDLVDDITWIANHQGLFATLAVAALPSAPSRATLDRLVHAPLHSPLRAWPEARWFAASEAVEELPVGPLPGGLAAYDALVEGVLERTLEAVDEVGTAGLATYGLFPRNWGDPLYADEVDCGADPTPADDADDVFWCSTWTDYHNSSATAAVRAMRSGETAWLDEIARPAALRSLHTQAIQCAPGDTGFFCGQLPTGYGAYRTDFNSSHAYLDNALLLAFLDGDSTARRKLERGARTMAGYLCPGRGDSPPSTVCAPDEPIADAWAGLNGRAAVQWYRVFRFLGLTADPRFLDDLTSNVARHLTLYHVEPNVAGAARGFNVGSGGGSFDAVDGPGAYDTTQLWMDALYDADLLHRLGVDTQDAPLGSPPLAPSTVARAWARTLRDVSSLGPHADGGPEGSWPNALSFTFGGARIGGNLVQLLSEVDADGDGTPCELADDDGDDDPTTYGDPCLYAPGKAALGASFARAATASDAESAAMLALARRFARFGVEAGLERVLPLGKSNGILLSRLHAAIARSTGDGLFHDGFDSGTPGAWSAIAP